MLAKVVFTSSWPVFLQVRRAFTGQGARGAGRADDGDHGCGGVCHDGAGQHGKPSADFSVGGESLIKLRSLVQAVMLTTIAPLVRTILPVALHLGVLNERL